MMRINHIIRWIFLLLCWQAATLAQATPKTLTMAMPEEGYAPFIIIENDNIYGILMEPLQLAAEKLGIKLRYVFAPEKRSHLMLDNHIIDLRMESEQWVDNPRDYLWSEPITTLEDVFVFHKDSKSNFETEQALAGAGIITHLGYGYPTLQPLFEQHFIHRIDVSSEQEMLNSLYRPLPNVNRAAVMNKSVAQWIIKSTPKFKDCFLFSRQVVGSAPLQFQFSKNKAMAETVRQLNNELIKMKQAHTMEKIADRILKSP